jgi:hypothetical protein
MNKNFVPFTDAEERIINKIIDERSRVETRFPLVFALMITFGFVSTLYGFEKLIDRVPLFVDKPWLLLGIGISTLLATGAAYSKLK